MLGDELIEILTYNICGVTRAVTINRNIAIENCARK